MTTTRDCYRGCLMGLAAGDAVATTVEFRPPGTFPPVTGMAGGVLSDWTRVSGPMIPPWRCASPTASSPAGSSMPRTRWTAATAGGQQRVTSAATAGVLISARRSPMLSGANRSTGNPLSGSRDPYSAGNGSLMRLAPVPLFFARDPDTAIRKSGESSRTTHGTAACVDACRYFGGLLVGAVLGETKETLLAPRYCPVVDLWDREPMCPEIDEVAAGSFIHREPPEIVGSGYVVKSLEAALWAFHRSDSFDEGCLLAVTLGDDADTTAAIYGQLAGAYYGIDDVPQEWKDSSPGGN